jgi:hypothetical protein
LLIEDFPEAEYHLGKRSSLVVDPDFKMGMMRIARGMPLTREQQNAVKNLVKSDTPEVADIDSNNLKEDVDESSASQVVKQLKL